MIDLQTIKDILQYGSLANKEKTLQQQADADKQYQANKKQMADLMRSQGKSEADIQKQVYTEQDQQMKQEKHQVDILGKLFKLLGINQDLISPQGTAPTPTQQPSPTPSTPEEFILNYAPYIDDPAENKRAFPKGMPQPSKEMLDIIRQVSPDDATRSGILKMTENRDAIDPYSLIPSQYDGNSNGTTDRGTNMINAYITPKDPSGLGQYYDPKDGKELGTFNDMWNQEGNQGGTYPYRAQMQAKGINSYEDMNDPLKNEWMMDLIRKVGGYKRWYGPRDSGFKHGL